MYVYVCVCSQIFYIEVNIHLRISLLNGLHGSAS